MNLALVDLYKTKRPSDIWPLETDDMYLEVGREFPMCHKRTGQKERPPIPQVTIRDIRLAEAVQRQGRFTAFIKFLLCEKKLAVQMECVENEWLQKRLRASPLWHYQGYEENDFNPCFVRFVDDTTEENFTLF